MNQLEELQYENKLLKKLATTQGFFQYYFEQLPKHRTMPECFNAVNDKYFDLFGEYRFESYYSFRESLAYHRKKRKN